MSEGVDSPHLHQHNVVTNFLTFASLISTEWYFMVAVIWIFIMWVRFCIFHICLYAYLNFLFHAWSVHIFSHFSIVLFLSFYWLIRIYWKRGGGFPFSMLYISEWKDIGKCKSCSLSDPLPLHSLQLWGREVNYLIGKFGRRKWTGLASLFLPFGICLPAEHRCSWWPLALQST